MFVIVITSMNMADFPVELRFENTKFNYLFVIVLSLLLPLSIVLSAFTFKKRAYLYSVLILGALVSVPCTLTFIFAISDYNKIVESGKDFSFEKINEVRVDKSSYRLYRTNGGATTSFGLVLRKESKFIGGLNTVEVIFSKYKASESTLSVVNKSTLQLQIEPYSEGEKTEVITLNI